MPREGGRRGVQRNNANRRRQNHHDPQERTNAHRNRFNFRMGVQIAQCGAMTTD